MKRCTAAILIAVMLISLCSCKSVEFLDNSSGISIPKIVTEYFENNFDNNKDTVVVKSFDNNSSESTVSETCEMYNSPSDNITVLKPAEVKILCDRPLYYDYITSEQKRIYKILLSAANQMVTSWVTLGKCKSAYTNDVSVAFRALTSDYPSLFWLPNSFLLAERSSKEILVAFCYQSDSESCDYKIKKSEKNEMEAKLQAVVNSIADGAKAYSTDFEKELYIHDRICEISSYEVSDDMLIYTAYGALVNGKAVCEGYSRAMQLVCDKAGIKCALVYGDASDQGHMWNMVSINDKWYHLDVTWDDVDGRVYHTYFNVDDYGIVESHSEYDTYIPQIDGNAPKDDKYNLLSFICDSNEDNYFIHNNYIYSHNANDVADMIYRDYSAGKNFSQFMVTDSDVLAGLNITTAPYTVQIQLKLSRKYGRQITLSELSLMNNILTLYW